VRLFVTGASGFLGREFIAAASDAGHDVVALVRRASDQVNRLTGEVVERDILELCANDIPEDLDAVVHFATGTDGDAAAMTRVAVEGTKNLIRLARASSVRRFIHISSMSVHSGPVAASEEAPGGYVIEPRPQLRGTYALSKVRAELAVTAAASGSMEIVICRPGLVFGRDMENVLAGTAARLPLGLAVGLGRPEQGVPWTDVSDFNTTLLAILASPRQDGIHTYELLSQRVPTKRELIESVRQCTGLPRRTLWLPAVVPVAAAAAFDAVRGDRSGRTLYKVRRAWRFDPIALDASPAWAHAGRVPQSSLYESVRRSLTVEAALDRPLDQLTRRRAAALLAVAHRSSAMNGTHRVVLVGAGRIVHEMHVPALEALDNARVAAVVDPRSTAASIIGQRLGAPTFGCLADVPDDVTAGAVVVVATPGSTHAEIAHEAIARGATVLLEKPAALRLDDFKRLRSLESPATPISVIQNYRLRPAVIRLWKFLLRHDVGPLVRARLRVASPPLRLEQARWMRDEQRNRTLLYEIAIHFIDLLVQVCGKLSLPQGSRVRLSSDGLRTISFSATSSATNCDDIFIDLDVAGTAPGVSMSLEFARSACILDFFPDGFRVLPVKPNPLDDAGAALGRIGAALRQRARRGRASMRAIPHRMIYREHFRRCVDGSASPFELAYVTDTMHSLEALGEVIYGNRDRAPTR
jgi:nucleoside-diphosphate-sugar epimerase